MLDTIIHHNKLGPRYPPQTQSLFRGIDNNAIQIRSLVVNAVEQTSNGDRVLFPFLEGKLKRCGEDNPLVGVTLEKCFHVGGVTVHNNAADTAELPFAANAVGGTLG